MFIAICGKQRSGKDTFAKLLSTEINIRFGLDLYEYRFSDTLYESVAAAWDVSPDEVRANKDAYRPMLQLMGSMRRSITPNYFKDDMKAKVHQGLTDTIITDVRVPEDVCDIKDTFGYHFGVFIKIEATEERRAERGQIVGAEHRTEVGLDDYKDWWYVVENDGKSTIPLHRQAVEFLDSYLVEAIAHLDRGWAQTAFPPSKWEQMLMVQQVEGEK